VIPTTERRFKMKIKPLADRVVVKPLESEEVTKSGIVLPDTAKEKPQEGKVIAVGPGKLLENGKRAKMDIKQGDRILYTKYGPNEVKISGEEYLIVKEEDILAVIK
jgi:chaperonin GroES